MNTEIYNYISINCKYRKRIKNLQMQVNEINESRKALEEKYSEMRKEVFKIKQIKLYKPVKGDVVDEMFAGHLNKAKLEIEVQRISASNYMFGTKKILAKIINDRLVIRVGGGYMNAEEFIEQHGKIEMMKMMKMEESKRENDNVFGGFDEPSGRRQSLHPNQLNMSRNSIRPGTALGQQIKEQMRQTLMTATSKINEDKLNKSSRVVKNNIARQSTNVGNNAELKNALEAMK